MSTPTSTKDAQTARFGPALRSDTAPVLLVLAVVMAALFSMQPTLLDASNLFAFFLKPLAPLALLAVGQMFVVAAGEFDLSVGSLITFSAIVAAKVMNGDDGRWFLGLATMLCIALVVGLINAFVTIRLRVPSLLATLAMLLVLSGAANWITGGIPKELLPESFRQWGRSGFDGSPVLQQVPYALVISVPILLLGWWLFHHTVFGTQLLLVGGNARGSYMSGLPVKWIRTRAFVISAVFAAVAGFLLSGFTGLSRDLGEGLEFQAIAAIVLGGAVLGGGRGSVVGAIAGATTLAALFTVLNLMGLPEPVRLSVQGAILIAAAGVAALRRKPR